MNAATDPRVEVIYIAFHAYGPEPLERFLASYRRWRGGCPHRLTVALKGYEVAAERTPVADRCRRAGASIIEVPEGGYDIGTYFHVAARTSADILCLLNSNSEILGDAWLAKLTGALRAQGSGAVSATGSWESMASGQWRAAADSHIFAGRRLIRMVRLWRQFSGFPNPHLRTNALVIGRTELLAAQPPTLRDKQAAWRLESGRTGLSAHLLRRRLPIAIVGRDGRAFQPAEWHRSNIFWQGDQGNLLVADNQTRRYEKAGSASRQMLHDGAWSDPRPTFLAGLARAFGRGASFGNP